MTIEDQDTEEDQGGFDAVDYYIQTKQAARSARNLPSIARSAISLARRANPVVFWMSSAAQLTIALLLGLQVLLGKLALEAVFKADATNGSVGDVVLPLGGLVAAGAVASVAQAFQTQGQRLLGEHVQRTTLDSVLEVTTSVELETFESPAFFDDLQRVQANALSQPLTMAQGLLTGFGGIITAVGMGIALVAIEPLLVPILLASALPLWYLSRLSGRVEFDFNVRQTPGARLRLYLVEVLIGRNEAKELRAFALGPVLRRRWDASYREYLGDLGLHLRRKVGLALSGAIATVVVTTGAFALLISFVLSDRISLASAGAAVIAIRLLSSQVQQIFVGIGSLFESSLFLEDLDRFLARGHAARERAGDGRTPVEPFAELTLEDVRFAYPGTDREAVRGVSMRIRAGEVVALVGENGSGKTTLAKLVAGLFSATGGRVLWDGTDVGRLDRTSVRRHVGIIFQDFVRYQLTARENVGFGRADAMEDAERVRAAAELAGASRYLERLPNGYDTLLGKMFSGGYDLSLGQWQRVALARAFFRDAHLLVLDEPTASLDARSEHELFEHVQALGRGRAVLLISHRFSTVKSADRIYVLHHGEVVEQGSHDELMAEGGRYAELFELQARAYR